MALSGNTQTLYLVCDTSGSMVEGGKCMLTRGIARAVEQYVRLGYGMGDIKLILWNTEATIADWNPEDEFPDQLLECGGSADAATLCELLSEKPDGKMLMITDGWWSDKDAFSLKKWKRMLPPDTLRIIKIGGDANPLLKGNGVFSADELFVVLDGWLPPADTAANDVEGDGW